MTASILDDDPAHASDDTTVSLADIDVHRLTARRTRDDPVIVRYAGPIIDIVSGPTDNTWSVREMVLCDRYGLFHPGGNAHDAVDIDRAGILPADIKTTTPTHDGRHRDGCLILRGGQHDLLMSVPRRLQQRNGFTAQGDYVCAVYERLDGLIILLDDVRLSARDMDRLVDPSFYDRGDKREASVEWTSVPGLEAETMLDRLDNAPVYLRALGYSAEEYRAEIDRVREQIRQVT